MDQALLVGVLQAQRRLANVAAGAIDSEWPGGVPVAPGLSAQKTAMVCCSGVRLRTVSCTSFACA